MWYFSTWLLYLNHSKINNDSILSMYILIEKVVSKEIKEMY